VRFQRNIAEQGFGSGIETVSNPPACFLGGLMGRYLLLWLLGVPLPVLVLIYAFGGLH
jgi:hypothetical protein